MNLFRQRVRSLAPKKPKILSFLQNVKKPDEWENERFKRWGNFWYYAFLDYRTVAVDVVGGAKKRPLKAAIVTSGLAFLYGAIKNNPEEDSFHNSVVRYTNDLIFVNPSVRNPLSESQVKFLSKCENEGLLRHINLILFSLIVLEDYNPECQVYAARCTYLKPKYLTFYERVVDIGIYGVWLNLWYKMRDYDVNHSEWEAKSPS